MKKLFIASIALMLILIFTFTNSRILATSNTPIYEQNSLAEDIKEETYDIYNSPEQMLKNMQELSEVKIRNPKGAAISIIVTTVGTIIIILIGWWYKTNY